MWRYNAQDRPTPYNLHEYLVLENLTRRVNVPKFAANGKKDVLIRHLMTHTSGLPDMPPDNLQLRKEQRPLTAFIESICRIEFSCRYKTYIYKRSRRESI